jgi:hypothetical protein
MGLTQKPRKSSQSVPAALRPTAPAGVSMGVLGEDIPSKLRAPPLNGILSHGEQYLPGPTLGRPPTLWWLLMVWLCFWSDPGGGHDSITSGYNVPCARFEWVACQVQAGGDASFEWVGC